MQKELLVLIDIDGTLLSPGLSPRIALSRAIRDFTGSVIEFEIKHLAGLTDPLIVKNALLSLGFSEAKVRDNGFVDKILERYCRYLKEIYPCSDDKHVFPDVPDFLRFLSELPMVRLGIITGNIRDGAFVKLSAFGLDRFFSFGVYGSDSEDRNELPLIALRRVRILFNEEYSRDRVIIIGDTHRDVVSAKVHGMKSIAVVRRVEWLRKIEESNPDLIVKDFSEIERFRDFFGQLTYFKL